MPEPTAHPMLDADQLLRANLDRVFNERNAERRDLAIAELYVADPIMYEPAKEVVGRVAISEIADQLQKQFGETFNFNAQGKGGGHHGMATLRWVAGTASQAAMFRGTDVVELVDGRISRLWVMFDASSP